MLALADDTAIAIAIRRYPTAVTVTTTRRRVATLSINIADLPADQTGNMLDADYGVCVRAGLHCAPMVHEDANTVSQKGTVRFSPGYFTDDEDMEQAILGVTELAEM